MQTNNSLIRMIFPLDGLELFMLRRDYKLDRG